MNGLNSGRFLDGPEFAVMHDKGNQENFWDRIDYQLSDADSVHMNLNFTRSWFQTPNSFDSQLATPWSGVVVNNNGLDPTGKQWARRISARRFARSTWHPLDPR